MNNNVVEFVTLYRQTMKKIKDMIVTSFSKKDAMEMLETFKIFGSVSETQYQKGKELIRNEYSK